MGPSDRGRPYRGGKLASTAWCLIGDNLFYYVNVDGQFHYERILIPHMANEAPE
jgi:hypothetical protein